jgi:hypothetical protein
MNEEDIKNLSEIIELCEEEINNNNENVTAILDLTDLKSLRNLINRNKEIEEDYISVYLSGFYDGENKWKSKVKEKIEEVNKSNGYSPVNKILIEQVLNSIFKTGG